MKNQDMKNGNTDNKLITIKKMKKNQLNLNYIYCSDS
jgi:hypothetical protein